MPPFALVGCGRWRKIFDSLHLVIFEQNHLLRYNGQMIAIIDYKAGNLKSVECALKKLGFPCCITHNLGEILGSERIIFPGVGAVGQAIAGLRHLGLDEVLRQALEIGKPILGICLGAQIILDKS